MRTFGLVLVCALAACGQPANEDASVGTDAGAAGEAAAPAPALTPVPDSVTPEQQAALNSKDCRTVVRGYLDAIAMQDFAFAARFWDDPVIDGARLQALFANYGQPSIKIGDLQEEGAAGSLYCSVTGTLSDLADSTKPLREGEIVLRRANDVPGATAEQLRWTVRSSSYIEPMERSGKGEPA